MESQSSQGNGTEIYINVPHNSGDNCAHNVVTVGPAMKDGDEWKMPFKAGNPLKDTTIRLAANGIPVPVNITGNGGVGAVTGKLTASGADSMIYFRFTGTINGWPGYGCVPYVKFPEDKPLLIDVVKP